MTNAEASASLDRSREDNESIRARPQRLPGDYWLWLTILLALGLRTYHVAYPPWDYHNWRQTQTLMVARDFDRHGFRLLHPQVQWVNARGPDNPSYFTGEFSIESLIAALLYKLFGESDTLARIVVITFSLFGILCLYELLNRLSGPIPARIGAFIYALLPYHLFFGRVFMPDVPALSLALAGLLFLSRWTDDRKPATLLAAAILTALAVLQKLTVLFVGLPALYLFWLAKGRRLFARGELYLFTAVAALPSLAWYAHADALSRQSGFAFVLPGLLARHLGFWFQPAFLHRNLTALWSEAFSPLGLGLAIVGFFWPAAGPAFSIFRIWSAAAGLLLFLIPDLLSANYYYFSLLLPAGAALSGLVLAQLASKWITQRLLALILAIFTIGAVRSALPLYQDDRAPRDLGLLLNRLTKPADLIAGESGGSPNLLYFADRRGWMLQQAHDVGLVRRLAKAGAVYYADPSIVDLAEKQAFFQAMDANFERLTPDAGTWPIYRLSAPAQPLRQLPAGEIQNSLRLKFGSQAELVGVSFRTLTESPAAFELLSFWRFLSEPAMDVRAFVHVSNAAGEAVYHANLKRLGAQYRASLKPGEIIRDQSVVALPVSLPKGAYRIGIGRADPTRRAGLDPDIRNEPNYAQVGEIEIRRTPNYGWFSPY